MVTLKYSGSNGVREHILRMNDMASQLKGLDMEISEGFLMHFIMISLLAQFDPFKINYYMQKEKWKMSELIPMCVQEEERLKSEQTDNAHVAITDIDSGLLEGNLYKLFLNASFTESLKTMNVNDVVATTCDYNDLDYGVKMNEINLKFLNKLSTFGIVGHLYLLTAVTES
ncbi:hypothetical protein RJ639_045599 [Escallonia herrerae]|uniref:Uncharacterized protein n=1 Tax=Escallonia herrerae TaxID=1293975 RepID=A0AA88W6Z1_9ASTE|nr:hypothetical protein RJ639_045599 [Escallonia herrerae]